jgi:hypothetical protein
LINGRQDLPRDSFSEKLQSSGQTIAIDKRKTDYLWQWFNAIPLRLTIAEKDLMVGGDMLLKVR